MNPTLQFSSEYCTQAFVIFSLSAPRNANMLVMVISGKNQYTHEKKYPFFEKLLKKVLTTDFMNFFFFQQNLKQELKINKISRIHGLLTFNYQACDLLKCL